MIEVRLAGQLYRNVDRSGGPDACWPWKRRIRRDGYGDIWARSIGEQLAHRVAWFVAHGPIPDGLCVLHRCDNKPCCNPRHLFLGTQLDNMHDMIAKGRRAKLTPEQCKDNGRKIAAAAAAKTPEQRSEVARKRAAAMTPEARSEAARKANASRTPEQRRDVGRKARASLTPERWSELGRKAAAARWSRP